MVSMDENWQQNEDDSWSPAEPIPMQGWKGRTEMWCRRHHFRRLANLLGWWDERGLG